ncbi:m7GpppN-mRNA hydrolase-like [Octopus vulgaris]|uniref:m7GpppN-mRNA hydrolase n=1 Tax=Octopus vulgaris TaxID=6645 RepID=A0AA36BC26_OCTVU|nr:m7GpppN-mRNA hydrolase-like [Octopus vulgaris]
MEQQTSVKVLSATPQPFIIPAYVLDDLCSRFIINIPQEERLNPIRIFFQIELAHWFYLDFYCIENPDLHTCGIKDFSSQIFRHCPFLNQYAEEVDKRFEDWKQYKMSVPTYGAIILDPEMKFVLLVQGYWAKSSWGFPKGKINEDETEQECAVREVFEETGFNISKFINSNDYFENQMNDQLTRLYIIAGVSLDTEFQTKTRKEIKCMQWFPVDALPAHKKDQTCRSQLNMNSNNFFTIIPFIKQLRKWIMNKKQQNLDLKTGILGPVPNGNTVANVTIPVTGNCRQLTDKQRLKQQQLYNQKLFNDFQEYQKMRDGKINTGQISATTSGGSKLMPGNGDHSHLATEMVNPKYQRKPIQQTASPKQHYKKILTRDKDEGYSLSEITLTKAHSWTNFKLNFDALWT